MTTCDVQVPGFRLVVGRPRLSALVFFFLVLLVFGAGVGSLS